MGNQCGASTVVDQDQDCLALMFGMDDHQKNIQHTHQIECTNKEIQKLLHSFTINLRNEKTLYKDPMMPSEPIILKSKTKQFRCTYERPYTFLHLQKGDSYKLIDQNSSHPGTIQVKDEIMQYFGVFLCFLADKPALIKKIINTNENSYGIHCIEAYQEGKVTHLFIDDYILCRENKTPVFSQPNNSIYMWPCILEKAWLKIKGNSARKVEQDTPQQVFEVFMPLPIQKITLQNGLNLNSKQKLKQILFSFSNNQKNKGFICRPKKDPQHQIGFSNCKYFYLLGAFKYQGKMLFYLRNPSGEIPFRGLYQILDNQLKSILKSKNLMGNTEGNYLLDEDEFIEQIAEIMIVHYTPGNKITSYNFPFKSEQQFFIGFQLKNKGQLNLCVTQTCKTPSKTKAYHPLTYQIIRLSDMKLIGGAENKQGCFGVKQTYLLDRFNEESISGLYIIRLKKKQFPHLGFIEQTLFATFNQNIKFQISNQQQLRQKWTQFLLTEGAKQLANSETSRVSKSNEIAHIVGWIGDIAYVYIQKKCKKSEISIQVNFPELMNLQCISHPDIKRSDQWVSYKFSDKFLIIFEKIDLTGETHIRQYFLESY